ncbi:MAG: hypothetical protein ACK5JM_11045 [Rhodoblastus sp.]
MQEILKFIGKTHYDETAALGPIVVAKVGQTESAPARLAMRVVQTTSAAAGKPGETAFWAWPRLAGSR